MRQIKTLSVVIPVYNEGDTIREILKRVERANIGRIKKEIIIVDDGSTDGTRDILKRLEETRKYKIFYHQKNQGKGAALRTGFSKTTGEIIVVQDADLEYNPACYSRLIKPIISGETRAVYGSRFLSRQQRRKNIKFLKGRRQGAYLANYLGGRLLTAVANLLYGANITDEATCYKVFSADLLKSIRLDCKRFEFCPEVTAKIRKRKERIVEIPISYKPRTIEEGKKINWRDGIIALWTLIKYRFIG